MSNTAGELQPGTSKIKGKLAKGCGCFSIGFLVLFVWGIWSATKSFDTIVEVPATVEGYFQSESTNADAKIVVHNSPIVSYEFAGESYRDTLFSAPFETGNLAEGSAINIFLDPETPQFARAEGMESTLYFYFVYLFLAGLFYVGYRWLKNGGKQIFNVRLKPVINEEKPLATNFSAKEAATSTATPEAVPKVQESKKEIKYAPIWLTFLIGIIFIIGGLGLGYYKFDNYQIARLLREKGVEVKGVITDVSRQSSGKSNSSSRRTYNYKISYDYGAIRHIYKTSFTNSLYQLNEEVIMLVNPDKPSQARVNSSQDLTKGSYLWTLLSLAAGVLIIYGGQLRVKNRKQKEKVD